jgi:prepilin-type N-terminal cleavage/methylation domain-containing protein
VRQVHSATAPPARRAGVTLVELLVVMAIIGVLASLTIGAVINVRASQEKSFTEATIKKLMTPLDQGFKAVFDQVREELGNSTNTTLQLILANLAGNDMRRAKVIYLKLRLKQEFPSNYADAIAPAAGYLAGKPAYAATLDPSIAGQPYESSACLYAALKQSRRGMSAYNPDDIDPNFVRSVTASSGKQVSYFVDIWGSPLQFYLFPFDNDELNDQTLPYGNPTTRQQSRDPQDPEGTLMDPTWRYTTAPNYSNNAKAFMALLHPLPSATYPTAYSKLVQNFPDMARNLIPVIVSRGKDGKLGYSTTPDPNYNKTATFMTIDPSAPNDSNDNIISYRLRQAGARGD